MDSFFPGPDGLALPASPGLFKFLSIFTYTLHIIPMAFLIGLMIFSIFFYVKKSSNPEIFTSILQIIGNSLPLMLTFTLVSGALPLLFVQLLYGQAFYPAAILTGWMWYLVLAFILFSFFGVWLFKNKVISFPSVGIVTLALSLIALLVVNYVFTNVSVLMLSPEAIKTAYLNPSQSIVSFSDPQVAPRWIFFFVTSIALSGLLLNAFGHLSKKISEETREYLFQTGFWGYTIGSVLSIIVVIYWLLVLPDQTSSKIWSSHYFELFVTALVFAIVFLKVSNSIKEAGIFIMSPISAFFAVFIFGWIRHGVREQALEPVFIDTSAVDVQTDYGNLFLFFFLISAGIVYLVYLTRLYYRATHSQS